MQELESTNWSSGCADEMIRQLLDNNYLRPEFVTESSSGDPNDSPINQLMYEICSGPTIEDIESVVSLTDCNSKNQPGDVSKTRFVIFNFLTLIWYRMLQECLRKNLTLSLVAN